MIMAGCSTCMSWLPHVLAIGAARKVSHDVCIRCSGGCGAGEHVEVKRDHSQPYA